METNLETPINIRRQLTLFLEDNFATIEKIRKTFNPEQYKLIKAHVTLCREDEIENLEQVLENLRQLDQPKITITLQKPTRFDNGKGVFLKACDPTTPFDNLRKAILQHSVENPRKQMPHITLLHPRNATCNDAIFEQINLETFPTTLTFSTISLIEQKDAAPWEIIKEFRLRG